MELVITLHLFVVTALDMMKQTRLAHYLPMRGKNITTAVISTTKGKSAAECARLCVDSDICESFFYNTVTGECQYHDVVFPTPAGATNQEGLQYHFIINGRNEWCLVEKDFQLLTENGPCVKFHTDMKTWDEANETCVSYSPYTRLVVLDNYEKNKLDKAAGIAINNQFTTGLWMGMWTFAQDHYRWVNGQDVSFTDWASLDESNTSPGHCGYHLRGISWRWSRIPCTNRMHYVCEVGTDIKQYRKMMGN